MTIKAPAKKKMPPKIMLKSKPCGALLLLLIFSCTVFWGETKDRHKGAGCEKPTANEIKNPTGDIFKNGEYAQGNKNEKDTQCHIGKTGKTEDESACVFRGVIHRCILHVFISRYRIFFLKNKKKIDTLEM